MSVWGLHLANGDNRPDFERLRALGCSWYLALHYQLEDLIALLRMEPAAHGMVRYFGRDLLSANPDEIARNVAVEYRRMQAAGIADLIPGNEFNVATEGPVYGPEETARRLSALLTAVRRACPGVRLHLPAFSPAWGAGVDYYIACRDRGCFDLVDIVDLHAYGESPDALAWVELVAEIAKGHRLVVTEYNFGAGRRVDPDHYARDAVAFVAGAAALGVEAVCIYIWRWQNPDMVLPTPVDVRGQPIEQAIKQATKEASMAAEYPGAAWRPSPNFGYPRGQHGRNGQQIIAIVDHITAGPFPAVDATFLNPTEARSAHYVVKRDGGVVQYVAEADAAWTSGIDYTRGYAAYRSDRSIPWIDECWRKLINPNLRVINIEHEAAAGQGLTEPQTVATIQLHRHLCRKHRITADAQHIVGHSALDAVNRPNDPGPAFPWARLFRELGGEAMDEKVRAEIVANLDIMWGNAQRVDAIGRDIIRLGGELVQAAAEQTQAVIAIKRALGLP